MVTRRPGLASYARVAYARELTGDLEGALAAMRLALERRRRPARVDRVGARRAREARGRARARRRCARRHARAALRVFPGYPAARLELARVEATRGNESRARSRQAGRRRRRFRRPRASRSSPTCSSGRGGPPRRGAQRATVAAIERLLGASGVRGRPRVGRVPRRSADPAGETVRARPPRAGGAAVDLRRRRPRAGRWRAPAAARRRCRSRGARCGSGRRTRCSSSTAATRRAARATARAMREWYARALALDPAFSVRWAPVARAALGS